MNGKLDGLQKTVNSHGERLDSLEDNAESLHQRLATMESCYERLQADSIKLTVKLTELEGRHRRCNIRLIGLPEGIEGPQPSKFFSQLIQDVFGQDTFPSPLELDRVLRSLAPKPGTGDKPRPVIICFHQYQNKDLVIREARKRRDLKYHNNPFRIYEDYSADVVSQRKKYSSVMSDLYKMGLKPSLLFPARLRITNTDGSRTAFSSVTEAEKFVADSKNC